MRKKSHESRVANEMVDLLKKEKKNSTKTKTNNAHTMNDSVQMRADFLVNHKQHRYQCIDNFEQVGHEKENTTNK